MKRQSHLLKRRERRLRNSIALRLVRNGVRGEDLDFESVLSQPMHVDDGHHRDNDHSDVSADETNGTELL